MAHHRLTRLAGALLSAVAIAAGSAGGTAHAAPAPPPPPEPIIVVPAIYPGDAYIGTFTANNVKVRNAPRTNARLVALGQPGHLIGVRCVQAIPAFEGEPAARWYRISGPNNTYQGWVDTRYAMPVIPIITCGPGVS